MKGAAYEQSTKDESYYPKTGRKVKSRFIVAHEYSGKQSMRTAFEQAIETQACGQFESWLEKVRGKNAC